VENGGGDQSTWVNSRICVCSPAILDWIPPDQRLTCRDFQPTRNDRAAYAGRCRISLRPSIPARLQRHLRGGRALPRSASPPSG
jgi:hypothetical protein